LFIALRCIIGLFIIKYVGVYWGGVVKILFKFKVKHL